MFFDVVLNNKFVFRKISLYVKWEIDRSIWVNGNSFYTAIASSVIYNNKLKFYDLSLEKSLVLKMY